MIVVAYGTLVGTGQPPSASADSGGPQFTWTPTGLPARFDAAMAYDADHQRVVLFGGREFGGAVLNDTWTWDGSVWTPRTPPTSPPARSGAPMAYDAATGTVVLFGGSGYGPQCNDDEDCNDTWTWDGTTWTEQSPAHTPSARQGAAMAYDAAHQQIVLFGGSNNASGGLGDTWTWDGSDWTEQSPAHSPGASFSSMAYDAANGTVVLFDGNTWTWDGSDWTQQSPLHTPSSSGPIAYDAATQTVDLFGSDGETWTWDGSDWTEQTPTHSPSARSRASMAYDSSSGSVILFGGVRGSPDFDLGEWWTWDGTDWSQESQGNPSGRDVASMVYDSDHQQVVLFGGNRDDSTSVNDTWTWDGAVWTKQTPATSPPVRGDASMAYDSDHQRAVLFGGQDASGGFPSLDDTWTWDGSDWTQQSPAHSPSARVDAAMAYDADRQQVVLFGGDSNGDTWTWDGSDWTLQTPAHHPPARYGASMAYDPVQHEVVLFGGCCPNRTLLADTWTWDGSDWTERSPVDHPSGREFSAMAFDPATGTVVLFGGFRGNVHLAGGGETWEWDGNTWTQLFPPTSPTPRYLHVMAFDTNGNALVFGGYDLDPGQDSGSWAYGLKPSAVGVVGKHGGTVATKNALSSTHPLKTSVTVGETDAGGMVSIAQTGSTKTSPLGFAFLNAQATVTAPHGSSDSPLTLKFRLAPSLVSGDTGATVDVFRSEGIKGKPVEVAPCSSVSPPSPDPCVSSESTTPGDPVQITVLTSSASTWNFAFPGKSLTVSKRGTGAGAVTSQPWGLSCGAVCRAGFLSGTKVALTAAPRTGSVFARWSGDCTGTRSCKLTMSHAHTVTASFVHKPDAAIKLRADSSYVGRGVYNTTAHHQTRAVRAKRGTTEIFDIAVQNRGTAVDGFKLKGLGSASKFTVKYLAGKTGTTNITGAVEAGSYRLRIPRAGTKYIRMMITVKSTAAIGSTFSRLVTTRSTHASMAKDAVKGAVDIRA